MSERHLIRTSTNILCVRDSKILLSRRQNTGWSDGMLCIPGGHIEISETPTLAAVRELEEELGLKISANALKFFCVAQRKSGPAEYVAYEFTLKLDSDQEVKNTEPDICSELVWADPNSLPDDVIQDFEQIITLGYVQKVPYLEIGYN